MEYKPLHFKKMSDLMDENGREIRGSFSVKQYVEINGLQQGMIIEGVKKENPVLLFLHGGPGFPIYPFLKGENVQLHKFFTVCYWDQRGTGMSYQHASKSNQLSLEQLIKDTVEVTKYLCDKFGKEKIYLLGHSWGSFLGSIVAARFPAYYHAYIGAGQVGVQVESEKETLEYLLHTAKSRNDKKAQEKMQKVTIDEYYYQNKQYGQILGRYLLKYGGGMKRQGYSNGKLMKHYLFCRAFTIKERINVIKGAQYSFPLIKKLAMYNLIDLVPKFDIPIYIFQGKYDYQTTYTQAKRFFDNVKAPSKKFYTFKHSAHSPFAEEKELFYQIIDRDIYV